MPLGAVARCDWLPLHLSTWAPGGVRPSPELQSWSREAPLRSSVLLHTAAWFHFGWANQ